jgi:hypothetical protein
MELNHTNRPKIKNKNSNVQDVQNSQKCPINRCNMQYINPKISSKDGYRTPTLYAIQIMHKPKPENVYLHVTDCSGIRSRSQGGWWTTCTPRLFKMLNYLRQTQFPVTPEQKSALHSLVNG